jgi:hypothetical protein
VRGLRLFWMLPLLWPTIGRAVTLGQVDDFQDGTRQGWGALGGDALLSTASSGGPGGAGDRCLGLTSYGGTGLHNVLRAWNSDQWRGNYASAGVTAIEMDARNTGTDVLALRIIVVASNVGTFTQTVATSLAPDRQWHRVTFSLVPADLVWVLGPPGTVENALRGVDAIYLQHQPGPAAFYPTPVAAQLTIDNVRAIPEPATLALVAVGAASIRRRRVA